MLSHVTAPLSVPAPRGFPLSGAKASGSATAGGRRAMRLRQLSFPSRCELLESEGNGLSRSPRRTGWTATGAPTGGTDASRMLGTILRKRKIIESNGHGDNAWRPSGLDSAPGEARRPPAWRKARRKRCALGANAALGMRSCAAHPVGQALAGQPLARHQATNRRAVPKSSAPPGSGVVLRKDGSPCRSVAAS